MKIAYNCRLYLNIKDKKEIDEEDIYYQDSSAFDHIEQNIRKFIEVETI